MNDGFKNRHLIAACAVVAVLMTVFYVGFGIYFDRHFYPNTKLNGIDVSNFEISSFLNDYCAELNDYILYVDDGFTNGFGFTVNGADIAFVVDDGLIEDAKSQLSGRTPFLWILDVFGNHEYTIELKSFFNEDNLKEVVLQEVEKFNDTAVEPQNAEIVMDGDSYKVKKEVIGTQYDANQVFEKVKIAVGNRERSVNIDGSCLVKPTVLSSDERLVNEVKHANAVIGHDILIFANGENVGLISKDAMKSLFSVSSDGDENIDFDSLHGWVLGNLSSRFDTVGAYRAFTSESGKYVEVSGGPYGWLVDVDSTVDSIISSMNDETFEANVVFASEGYAITDEGGRDWRGYVNVDLSNQHAVLYGDGGEIIWESDVITGNPNNGHATPQGVYTVGYGYGRNVMLVGSDENNDGEPDYRTPVAFWMPFVENSIGLHDATWQPSFGGDMYANGYGSHGCVNLPYASAAELFDLIDVGTVVCVHY